MHEVNYEWGREAGRHARLTRALWRRPSRIFVHTETERQAFIDAFDVPADRVRLIGHGDNFVRRTAVTRDEARALLGIDPDRFAFLSIGFIQPHKGFDRAVRAFADLGLEGCRFDVVGSLRVEEPAYVAYLTELRRVVDATPNAHLHTGYVSDEAFDQWLVAVDCLVLPYRHIWSSGVLERAALYDTPVIVTAVGGIESQAPPGTIVISDDLELRAAMRRVAGADEPIASHDEVSWDADQLSDQTAVAAAVHRAAMAERGRAPRRFSDLEALAGQSLRAAHADTSSRQRGDAPSREAFDTLPHLIHPVPRGRSAVGSLGKRLAQRLTYWEVQPIIDHVNRLQDAVRDSLDHRAEGPEDAGR